MTKVCANCKREKPLSQFHLKAGYLRKVGAEHWNICKVCAVLRSLKGRRKYKAS